MLEIRNLPRFDSRTAPPLWFLIGVALIIVVALGLASTWALRAPYFLQPDERAHLDYALQLFDAGRPFHITRATAGMGVTEQEHYLDAEIGFRRLRYDPTARVRPDYGSGTFITAFDANAPRPSNRPPRAGAQLPYISFLYPIGYYALVASAMRLADWLTSGSFWSDLLAARSVGVLLLVPTLLISVQIFRIHRFSYLWTLVALVCVAWFPLTSWVAGYVQPDNLSFLLVTLALWLGLRWQRSGRIADAFVLSLAVGALFFTKQHYGLCCWAAVLALAIPRLWGDTVSRPALTAILLVAIPIVCFKASFAATYAPGLTSASNTFSVASTTAAPRHFLYLLAGYGDGVRSAFIGGNSFRDYWFRFGERGEEIFPPSVDHVLEPIMLAAMLACYLLVGAAGFRVAHRIIMISQRRSLRTAVRLATSSLMLNVYFITTLLLIFAFVNSNEAIWLEGRYFLPLIVPMIVLGCSIAYGASRKLRRRLQLSFLGGLAAFSTVSAVCALAAIDREYYRSPPQGLTFDPMAVVYDVRRSGRPESPGKPILLGDNDVLEITGFAVDPLTGYSARLVYGKLDGSSAPISAEVGLPSTTMSGAFSDDRIANSGFRIRLPAQRLHDGVHRLQVFAGDRGLGTLPLEHRFDVVIQKVQQAPLQKSSM